ncbi:hypothetical protein LEP1GSC073_3776 [Leptospira noguchii str. Cascata]|nr:hypothetical protein LEP1GSC072_3744 [Leptospira noguchii str. Bonito]EMS89343.1 hypothetical protein LEP1GSC073_3776 [Leptospira noguchii str. Cascata]
MGKNFSKTKPVGTPIILKFFLKIVIRNSSSHSLEINLQILTFFRKMNYEFLMPNSR